MTNWINPYYNGQIEIRPDFTGDQQANYEAELKLMIDHYKNLKSTK
jgi:hypothetical protein